MKEYSTSEYEVKIGDPVVDAEVKATSTSVAIPCAAIPDGEYLISLEINGTAVAHRDTFSFASGSCTVGNYTLAYSSYAVTVSTTSNNDVVRLVIEPLKVVATDAFKAAVGKVAPDAPNELPAVAAVDEGKVLTVNNSGVWGASGNIVLEGTRSGYDVTITTSPLPSHDEFVNAYKMGRGITLVLNSVETIYLLPFEQLTSENSVTFYGIGIDFDYRKYAVYIHEMNGTVNVQFTSLDDFIVTLTPTAQDYSGTMDKTVAEINAAYEAGMEIVFRIYLSATDHVDIPLAFASVISPFTYMNFGATFYYAIADVVITLETIAVDQGTKQTYSTKVYALTPAT